MFVDLKEKLTQWLSTNMKVLDLNPETNHLLTRLFDCQTAVTKEYLVQSSFNVQIKSSILHTMALYAMDKEHRRKLIEICNMAEELDLPNYYMVDAYLQEGVYVQNQVLLSQFANREIRLRIIAGFIFSGAVKSPSCTLKMGIQLLKQLENDKITPFSVYLEPLLLTFEIWLANFEICFESRVFLMEFVMLIMANENTTNEQLKSIFTLIECKIDSVLLVEILQNIMRITRTSKFLFDYLYTAGEFREVDECMHEECPMINLPFSFCNLIGYFLTRFKSRFEAKFDLACGFSYNLMVVIHNESAEKWFTDVQVNRHIPKTDKKIKRVSRKTGENLKQFKVHRTIFDGYYTKFYFFKITA